MEHITPRLTVLGIIGAAGIAVISSESTRKLFGPFEEFIISIVALASMLCFWAVVLIGEDIIKAGDKIVKLSEFTLKIYKYTIRIYSISFLIGFLILCIAPLTPTKRYVYENYGVVKYLLLIILSYILLEIIERFVRKKLTKRR
jgi:hypothetical protein